jgi:hypothetical protein
MIYDNTLLFSDGQAVTTTAPSTNVVDLGPTGTPFGSTVPLTRDVGIGEKAVPLSVRVTTAFAGLTSLQVVVQTSADNSTWIDVEASRAVPAAELVAGFQFHVPDYIPEGVRRRYMRLNYVVVGTGTAGAITAGAVMARQTNRTFGGA